MPMSIPLCSPRSVESARFMRRTLNGRVRANRICKAPLNSVLLSSGKHNRHALAACCPPWILGISDHHSHLFCRHVHLLNNPRVWTDLEPSKNPCDALTVRPLHLTKRRGFQSREDTRRVRARMVHPAPREESRRRVSEYAVGFGGLDAVRLGLTHNNPTPRAARGGLGCGPDGPVVRTGFTCQGVPHDGLQGFRGRQPRVPHRILQFARQGLDGCCSAASVVGDGEREPHQGTFETMATCGSLACSVVLVCVVS